MCTLKPNELNKTEINTKSLGEKKVTEAAFQTTGPVHLHAVSYLSFINSSRNPSTTVTYHFSDSQEVYSGNSQIHI